MAVAALAGRRIDPVGQDPARFPQSSIPAVRRKLEALLASENITLLVCSAASGADLLALDTASRLRIRTKIILPFEPDRFRATSVVDRSPEWSTIYDRLIKGAQSSDDLIILKPAASDDQAYASVVHAIIDVAQAASRPDPAIAILVWDGKSRGDNDYSEQFRNAAKNVGMGERIILTR